MALSTKLVALQLCLDRLGIDRTIKTVDDRKRIQKSVYLTQETGIDFGYRFNWYLMGPYSPALTEDYYSLEDPEAPPPPADAKLSGEASQRLDRLKPLLKSQVQGLPQDSWLELVASVRYLLKKYGDEAIVHNVMKNKKRHLAPYVDSAMSTLRAASVFNA
jgi:hypothetical protein